MVNCSFHITFVHVNNFHFFKFVLHIHKIYMHLSFHFERELRVIHTVTKIQNSNKITVHLLDFVSKCNVR